MVNKVQKIREGIKKRYEYWKEKESNSHSIESEARMSECKHLLLMLDSLQEEPAIVDAPPYDYVKGFSDGRLYEKRQKEELVSEDLEKEIDNYIKDNFFGSETYGFCSNRTGGELDCVDVVNIARHFANWQERQDQETIELAEDHAMLAGMNKMEQQMMAKAIDAKCFGFQGDALFSFKLPADNYLVGSEVKVIVIEEN